MSSSWILLSLLLPQGETELSAQAEQAHFRLPIGYRIECVVSEPEARKIVDIAFDTSGALWAVTASEYPIDGNEDPRAAELYKHGGKDQVLVIERPWEGTHRSPRVFAEGLAMPMTVLPLPEGVLVGHGSEILRLRDTNMDGRADAREVLLSGFGIEDSHLLPHRFLRAPDGWIYMAQGAFNYSLVVDGSGAITRFEQCKVGRFTRDGMHFEVLGVGLNNIWGMVFDEYGEFLVQEANDLGYGVAPFAPGASYPGIGQHRFRPYAPLQSPGTDLRFGGTGLSGLARTSSERSFPAPFDGAVFVANPIERRVQAVRPQGRGLETRFEMLPAFVESKDPRFRPIAVHFGPDDSLYIVDWYNPIISHNEVARTHPDRDRIRTRVWRVRHESQGTPAVPNLQEADEAALMSHLGSPVQFAARGAWHEIVDRRAKGLALALRQRVLDSERPVRERLLALWSLEGLRLADLELTVRLLRDREPALRRTAVRALAASGADAGTLLALGPSLAGEQDTETRCEWLRALSRTNASGSAYLRSVLQGVPAPDERNSVNAEQDNTRALRGDSLAAMRIRMWMRVALEGREQALERMLDTDSGIDIEAQALSALVLGGADGAARLAAALQQSAREPHAEELQLLVRFHSATGVLDCLEQQLMDPLRARATLEALLTAPPDKLDAEMQARICAAALAVPDVGLQIRLTSTLSLRGLAPALANLAGLVETDRTQRRDALRALARLRHDDHQLYVRIADSALPGDELQVEALLCLCSTPGPDGPRMVIERLADLPPTQARRLVAQLCLSREGASGLVQAFEGEMLSLALLDAQSLQALEQTLGQTKEVQGLREQLGRDGVAVLSLSGGPSDAVKTNLRLAAPFTIEAWVQCAEGVENREGILGAPSSFDFNFAGARPRLYLGPQRGDVIISRARLEPGRWTHLALSATAGGELRLYFDGILDEQAQAGPMGSFEGLDIGRTTPGHGQLNLCEVRVWDRVRSGEELAADRERRFDAARPSGLVARFPGDDFALDGEASVQALRDAPRLLDEAAAQARRARFAKYAELARKGDKAMGPAVFATLCQQCHLKNGVGASVGPPLDGIHNRGLGGILSAILEPSAAVESGYRVLRVDLRDETALEGLLVRSDDASVTIRPANASGALEPVALPRSEIARLRWSSLSVMPEGLLDSISDEDASHLLAFLLAP